MNRSVEEFRMPDLGEGLTEADLVSWTVAVGDRVELNQVVAEVETAKAMVELPSPFAGTVAELLAEPGTTVPVGTPIIRIAVTTDAGQDTDGNRDAAGGGATPPTPVLVGYGPGSAPVSRRATRVPAPAVPSTDGHTEPHLHAEPQRPDAKPSARREARRLGVDLTTVTGTGNGGVVTRSDVRRAADRGVRAEPGRETRVPVTAVRRRTAEAVTRSAFTAPHATVFLTCDATATVDLVERLRAHPSFADRHPTALTIVAAALLGVVADQPVLNATWDQDAGEIATPGHVNLGIATATDEGLLVPVIRGAEVLSLPELAGAIAAVTATARAGRATPSDLTGGTISITNVGVFGVDAGTPILVPGQAAILAIGAIAPRPWVVDDMLAVRRVVTLSLSFDHRLVDGEQAGRALAGIGTVLGDPVPALLGR
ncbi:dihydrolipoamide acetyltransferase family protein [Rhodococcus phenolicus]|uniref:dihydrolipoamide acetyltransferase family protein n=1 Tax=Rhodococcus phenolicus TaxID=263849 RepID=UPI00082E1769|nr:dihydrolipoamide acetyltransferase family protein [Rhodococcus phenolicus]